MKVLWKIINLTLVNWQFRTMTKRHKHRQVSLWWNNLLRMPKKLKQLFNLRVTKMRISTKSTKKTVTTGACWQVHLLQPSTCQKLAVLLMRLVRLKNWKSLQLVKMDFVLKLRRHSLTGAWRFRIQLSQDLWLKILFQGQRLSVAPSQILKAVKASKACWTVRLQVYQTSGLQDNWAVVSIFVWPNHVVLSDGSWTMRELVVSLLTMVWWTPRTLIYTTRIQMASGNWLRKFVATKHTLRISLLINQSLPKTGVCMSLHLITEHLGRPFVSTTGRCTKPWTQKVKIFQWLR